MQHNSSPCNIFRAFSVCNSSHGTKRDQSCSQLMSIHLAKALIITALLLVFCTHCLVIYDTSRGQESIAESVINALDRSVDPCDDFYQFSCGGWLKNTTIPEDSARVSKGFDVIGKRNFVVLKDILDNDKDISPFLKTFYSMLCISPFF